MQSSEGTFQGDGDLELYYQSWHPEEQPKAALVVIHGVAEHSNRYHNLVSGLVPHNIALYSFDQRGHGKSPGERGFIESWSEYRADFGRFLALVHQLEPEIPLFAYGHSQGALEILDYLLEESNHLTGVIVSGSPLDTTDSASWLLVAAAKILSRVMPTFSLKSPIDPGQLSCDARVVEAYKNDPTVFKILTARWGTEYLDTQKRVLSNLSQIELPIMIIHGGEDTLCNPAGSQVVFNQVASNDKTLKIYPSYFHEIHNEPGHATVIQDIHQWLGDRLPENGKPLP